MCVCVGMCVWLCTTAECCSSIGDGQGQWIGKITCPKQTTPPAHQSSRRLRPPRETVGARTPDALNTRTDNNVPSISSLSSSLQPSSLVPFVGNFEHHTHTHTYTHTHTVEKKTRHRHTLQPGHCLHRALWVILFHCFASINSKNSSRLALAVAE